MAPIIKTLNIYLIGMSLVYLFAFTSIYVQSLGLYGNHGLLPIRNEISYNKGGSIMDNFKTKPSVLWFMKNMGLNEEMSLDLMLLTAIVISFCSVVFYSLRNMIVYAILWALYFSVFQIGQTFLWFQWDMLLLESGFLTIIVAPLVSYHDKKSHGHRIPRSQHANGYDSCQNRGSYTRRAKHSTNEDDPKLEDPTYSLRFWLIKWLCFRLMFASGLVKLTSKCPSWWALDAMNWHYESQCIPTPLAWYAHQLPPWFQRLSVVLTLVIESALPFLFFSPIRIHRLFSGYAQVFLMVLILLTGNFNFFNIHIIILHFCLADDKHFGFGDKKTSQSRSFSLTRFFRTLIKFVFTVAPFVIGAMVVSRLFDLNIKVPPKGTKLAQFEIGSRIDFTQQDFFHWLTKTMPITIWIASISLVIEIVIALKKCLYDHGTRFFAIMKTVLYAHVTLYFFVSSCVPYYDLDSHNASSNLWPISYKWYEVIRPYRVANSYGLFRSMTGIGGRPEIIILGSNDLQKGWQEYEFMYKIGDVRLKPPFMVPHQPRLDWQMWFAALDTYQYNPWLLHLVYKLLTNEKDVLNLLGHVRPFKKSAPKYIKIDSYQYHFTRAGDNSTDWWTREKVYEYFPAMSKDSPEFLKYLSMQGFQVTIPKSKIRNKYLANILKMTREVIMNSTYEPHYIIWGLSFTALALLAIT